VGVFSARTGVTIGLFEWLMTCQVCLPRLTDAFQASDLGRAGSHVAGIPSFRAGRSGRARRVRTAGHGPSTASTLDGKQHGTGSSTTRSAAAAGRPLGNEAGVAGDGFLRSQALRT